jgi:hypothetical protein
MKLSGELPAMESPGIALIVAHKTGSEINDPISQLI